MNFSNWKLESSWNPRNWRCYRTWYIFLCDKLIFPKGCWNPIKIQLEIGMIKHISKLEKEHYELLHVCHICLVTPIMANQLIPYKVQTYCLLDIDKNMVGPYMHVRNMHNIHPGPAHAYTLSIPFKCFVLFIHFKTFYICFEVYYVLLPNQWSCYQM